MSRCLRCGAGNEWIEPIGKEYGHEAELAALRAEVTRLKEISEAFREHETLRLPEAGMRYLERIVTVEPRAMVCSTLPHAIRVLCDEHAALRAALVEADEMAEVATRLLARIDHNGGLGAYTGGPAFVVQDMRSAVARFHAARKSLK